MIWTQRLIYKSETIQLGQISWLAFFGWNFSISSKSLCKFICLRFHSWSLGPDPLHKQEISPLEIRPMGTNGLSKGGCHGPAHILRLGLGWWSPRSRFPQSLPLSAPTPRWWDGPACPGAPAAPQTPSTRATIQHIALAENLPNSATSISTG